MFLEPKLSDISLSGVTKYRSGTLIVLKWCGVTLVSVLVFIVNISTSLFNHTHTHTQRERERDQNMMHILVFYGFKIFFNLPMENIRKKVGI